MPPVLGVIADDFTGALMVAGYLEGSGLSCPVLFDPAAATDHAGADVLMLATRSRLCEVAEALGIVARAAAALEDAGCARLAYKACATFDSTDQGNIGPVADLLSDRQGGAPVLMCAGYPAFNATVHQGYLFYRGRLVSESIKRLDPLTPMSDPDLVRFLSRQTRSPVRLLAHRVLALGVDAAGAAWSALLAEGARHVLMDCSDEADVGIGTALALARSSVVVASDPLVLGYARALTAGRAAVVQPPLRRADGPAAVIAGSVGPVVLAQLAAFGARHPVLTLDLLDPAGEAAQVAAALEWATARIGPDPFAISTATDAQGVARAQVAFGPLSAARKAERLLAGVAAGLMARGVRRFVVAGGETSGAVVAALGIAQARACPEGRLGTGFCVTQQGPALSLYLKPGKLGADDILLRALEVL